MSEQALTSLAILTVNWGRGQDVIESFVPLVAECLRKGDDQPISAVDLQAAIKTDFGLKIPIGALEGILARCRKRGLVTREHHVYVPVRDKLDDIGFARDQAEALRQHGCLLDKLRTFARDRYEIEWTEQEADAALLDYLQENSVPVLAAATDGDPLPQPRRQSRRTKHVMSAFAGHVNESDPEGFQCLETVVKGLVLSTVLFYPDLGRLETKFTDLDVYCDTPVLLPAIGYSEEGVHLQCVELIELLRELGATLKCFHHTEEEVAGVLEAEAARLRGSSDEPTDYYTSKPFSLAEVEELIIKLPATIRRLGIEIVDTPTWTESPDEAALDQAVESRIHYLREKAREKDVKSLAAVYRLRGGRRMGVFESAKAVFVTTNLRLARASSGFFHDVEGRGGIPICMTTTLLTRLAWVKKPMAAPELPRHMVIASSYAALNPSPAMWRKFLGEAERRRDAGEITDEQYHFLRSSREARKALMDETLGEENAFSAGTYDEVVAHATAQWQAEAKAKADTAQATAQAAEEKSEQQRLIAVGIDRVHRENIDKHAGVAGALVGWAVFAVLGFAVIVGAAATVPSDSLVDVKPLLWRIVIWTCLAVFLAITLFAVLVRHLPVLGIQRTVASRVTRAWRNYRYRKLDELHARAVVKP